MFEKELVAVNLEAAEIMLLVRIVVRSESAERSRDLERPRSNRSGKALTPEVMTTRPPVNDLRRRSLRARILALLSRSIASCSSGTISASHLGHWSLHKQSRSSHQSSPQGQV